MFRKTDLFSVLFLAAIFPVLGQVSPDCSTAIPICNNTPVNGGVEDYGLNDYGTAVSSGCLELTPSGFIESNSAWYRFRTGASGQLGFNIGFDASEDWDFALYRASDCGELGAPIRCNFYDNRDENSYMGVGEDPTGDTATFLYEPWLEVTPGEDYYLVVNNFSNTNSGFSIQFTGQIFVTNPYDALDCTIVSNLLGPPIAACEGDPIMLDSTTPDALSYEWYMDTGDGYQLIPGESGPTYQVSGPAFYRVVVSRPYELIISDVQVGFSPNAMSYEVADKSMCDDMTFDLQTLDTEALGPQSADEFRVSYHLSQEDSDQDANPLPAEWSPENGINTVFVRVTSLENPLCYDTSENFELLLLTSPLLDLPEQAFLCIGYDSPVLGPLIPEPGVTYLWSTGEQTPLISPTAPGFYTLTAAREVGDLQCAVSQTVEVIASVPPVIGQILVEDLQASNTITVVALQPGNFEYALNDGPFQSSPVFTGVPAGTNQLHMRDVNGCGSITETIVVVGFSSFFTPNGDGINDNWNIIGLSTLTDPTVFIFDRYGKLLKQLDDASASWDGTFNGRPLPSSDYWFRLNYTNSVGQRVEAQYIKAHFSLKR